MEWSQKMNMQYLVHLPSKIEFQIRNATYPRSALEQKSLNLSNQIFWNDV